MDLAEVEYKYPLLPADLQKITPENLAALSQEQIDQIYARLSAGPIPDGSFDGGILFPRGSSGKFRVAEIMGGLAGAALHLKGIELDAVGETLWQGKVFFRDERVLRNRIDDLSALKKLGLVEGDPKKISVNGKDAWLLFPAKLYCGQSLFDSRRESIIIDYFFTEEIPGYQEKPDFLAGPARSARARRDPHGAPRLLSRPRVSRPRVRIEFHAVQQGHRREGRRGVPADRTGQGRLLDGHSGACIRKQVTSKRRAPGDEDAAQIGGIPSHGGAACARLARDERDESCVRQRSPVSVHRSSHRTGHRSPRGRALGGRPGRRGR